MAVVVPSETDAPRNSSTVPFASAVPVNVGVLSFVVEPVVGEVIEGASGAAVSTVSATAVDALLVLFAESVAFAVIE